ncbi:MAG: hypothetical protein ABI347_08265 [Nitrososphaera sp.]|jgi:hypothetical protein
MTVEDQLGSCNDASLEWLQRSYGMDADELLQYVKRYGMHRHFEVERASVPAR